MSPDDIRVRELETRVAAIELATAMVSSAGIYDKGAMQDARALLTTVETGMIETFANRAAHSKSVARSLRTFRVRLRKVIRQLEALLERTTA